MSVLFAVRLTYTAKSIQAMIKNPDDREAFARKMTERAGCRLFGWYAAPPSADNDGWESLVIYEAPDPETHFALLAAAQSSGAFATIKTMRLLTGEQFMQVLQGAEVTGWTMPGQSH